MPAPFISTLRRVPVCQLAKTARNNRQSSQPACFVATLQQLLKYLFRSRKKVLGHLVLVDFNAVTNMQEEESDTPIKTHFNLLLMLNKRFGLLCPAKLLGDYDILVVRAGIH